MRTAPIAPLGRRGRSPAGGRGLRPRDGGPVRVLHKHFPSWRVTGAPRYSRRWADQRRAQPPNMGEAHGVTGEPNGGANRDRYQATPSHVQPVSVQLNSTSGAAQRRLAPCRKCLLSGRSQVRILLGAHTKLLVRALRLGRSEFPAAGGRLGVPHACHIVTDRPPGLAKVGLHACGHRVS